jgi:TonB family protein
MKGPKDAIPQMARNFDPDMMARNAGILGMIQQDSGHFLASPYGGAFAVGNDDEDVWGGLTGTEIGEAFGVGGLGLVGTGRGGGGTGEGTIGLGNVGLIGKGGGGGTGSGYGRGSGAGFGGRGKRVPQVRQAMAQVKGALDKDIIRRIVRAHIMEVRHCYNQGLVRDPNLKGRVAVQFTIGPTGKVPVAVVAQSSLKDGSVANCVAKAVKRWTFPKPQGGGNVVVTYPFVLEPG